MSFSLTVIRFGLLSVLIVAAVTHVIAQEKEIPKVEVFGGYSYLRHEGHGLNGWKAVAVVNVSHWFGVAADVDGYYRSEPTSHGAESESEHSLTFGPHVALRKKKLVPFGYALFGVARERVSVGGVSETATGFAAEFGGGLDYEVNDRVALRLFDAAASVTRINEHAKTKPKLSFGVVFYFGRRRE